MTTLSSSESDECIISAAHQCSTAGIRGVNIVVFSGEEWMEVEPTHYLMSPDYRAPS